MKGDKQPSRVRLGAFDPAIGFDREAGAFKFGSWYLVKTLFFLTPLPFPSFLKASLLRLFGAKVGPGLVIKPRVNIHFPWKLSIGKDVWIGEEANILNFERIQIGSNVCVSQRAFLCGGNHDYTDPAMPYRNGPIALHDGCWVGASCFVGPGVTIGQDSVIAAASVVTRNVEPGGIFKGDPLIFIKKRWQYRDAY